jgi:hypothetical protein
VKSFTEKKYNTWLFSAFLLICFLVSTGVRYEQFETWKKTPSAYFVGERPMTTTLDAPFWLYLARDYNNRKNGLLGDPGLRQYPSGIKQYQTLTTAQKFIDPTSTSTSAGTSKIYNEVPLLSFVIAHLAPLFNNNYYLTGTLLIPVLASLFILPLGIYFFLIGLPVCGLLGGLIGTFAGGYYMRASIGRIDTDMLNLFFPILVGLMILLASRAKKERSVLLFSVGAGMSIFLFQWWYGRPGFTLAYFMVLVFSFFIQRIRFRLIILSSILFLLCAHPINFMNSANSVGGFLSGYFAIKEMATSSMLENENNPATFPNVMTTISEASHVQINEVLRRILTNNFLGWAGLLALLGLTVLRWRFLLPLTPMLALGLLSFQSSNRFIMYLGPFIGIGLGWLLQIGVEAVFLLIGNNIYYRENKEVIGSKNKVKDERLKVKNSLWASFYSLLTGTHLESTTKGTKNKVKGEWLKENGSRWEGREFEAWNWARQGGLYLVMGVTFWLISGQTAISFVPGPSIHPKIYTTFLEVKNRIPEGSALLTWWDFGHSLIDLDLATFHDGGSHGTPITYFIARGLISSDQDELYDTTQFLATEGNEGIAENNTSPEALLAAVGNPQLKPWDPIYLFFTGDMTGKFGAISKLGSWDIVNGGTKPRGYQNLACNKITNAEMNCRGAKIDLKDGKINNQVPLKRMVFIRDGKVMREQDFGHAQGYTLQLLVNGQQIVEVQLIDEVVFSSNYNQMFLLGRYREDLYEETYNAFPFARLFSVKF